MEALARQRGATPCWGTLRACSSQEQVGGLARRGKRMRARLRKSPMFSPAGRASGRSRARRWLGTPSWSVQ
eukprot:6598284-Pyramimonas_sp.AAC.1